MDNVRIARCRTCAKYTIQQKTIHTPATSALVIPDTLGESVTLCRGDVYVWLCLQCNSWVKEKKNEQKKT